MPRYTVRCRRQDGYDDGDLHFDPLEERTIDVDEARVRRMQATAGMDVRPARETKPAPPPETK